MIAKLKDQKRAKMKVFLLSHDVFCLSVYMLCLLSFSCFRISTLCVVFVCVWAKECFLLFSMLNGVSQEFLVFNAGTVQV